MHDCHDTPSAMESLRAASKYWERNKIIQENALETPSNFCQDYSFETISPTQENDWFFAPGSFYKTIPAWHDRPSNKGRNSYWQPARLSESTSSSSPPTSPPHTEFLYIITHTQHIDNNLGKRLSTQLDLLIRSLLLILLALLSVGTIRTIHF